MLKGKSVILGTVLDAETGLPIVFANIRLKDTGKYRISRTDGSFQFDELPAQHFVLTIEHIGYKPDEQSIDLTVSDTVIIEVQLAPSVFQLSGSIVVTGIGRERGLEDVYQPTDLLGGLELQRRLQGNLSATLVHIPGISQQYFGSAASQPVIRGMGGDRMLILEDGQRTGDLASTAADHAVTVEPSTAERIEVVRGPAGLLYGSNALGGVINVIRDEIPRNAPGSASGTVTLGAESVYKGLNGGISLLLPAKKFVVRLETSGRLADDTRTPLGKMSSTDFSGYTTAIGLSYVSDWGFIGLSLRQHEMRYGVPGEFNGVAIPGAHFGGVDIEYQRRTGRLKGLLYRPSGLFSDIEMEAIITHYVHDEIEGRGASGIFYGTRFDQLSGGGSMIVRHVHKDSKFMTEGAWGISLFARDMIAGGGYSGSRSATEYSAAGYVYEEFAYRNIRLQTGLRYDLREIRPYSYEPIRLLTETIPVTDRSFSAFSGSIALLYSINPLWKIGVNLARAFRTPSIEELFSDGPHLADFSYDIGNPKLRSEYGFGVDIFARLQSGKIKVDVTGFRNLVSNYIFYAPTGQTDPRFRRFPVFQATGRDALFYGAEGKLEWEVLPSFVLDGGISYVYAERRTDGDPLPSIPPFNGNARLRFEGKNISASFGYTGSAAQYRVPRPIQSPVRVGETIHLQRPTEAYNLFEIGVGYRWIQGKVYHSIMLGIQNLGDAVWHDHLSRIKDVAPQPGRNIHINYRLMF